MIYHIKFRSQATEDIEKVIDYIEQELFAPMTAEHFARGLYAKIDELRLNAGIYAISTYNDILEYGITARHVNYKGFAIIYTIHGKMVVIHRIIHGSAIKK
jgi:plasmid stabilization system protein ParE